MILDYAIPLEQSDRDLDYYRVDNVRHTSGYFFIENFIMAEIFQPSDKKKISFLYYFNNEPV